MCIMAFVKPTYLTRAKASRTGLVLLACALVSLTTSSTSIAADKFKAITTFTVIADMARNVGGDMIIVESITRPGAEIHHYSPTPRDILRAQDADLILWNGMNLEMWFSRFFTNLKDAMVRIGREAIITFPNFGHWRCRLHLGLLGRMPVSRVLPFDWYDTPNIHFCTVKDFEALCEELDIKILDHDIVSGPGTNVLKSLAPNLFGSTAIYRVCKK